MAQTSMTRVQFIAEMHYQVDAFDEFIKKMKGQAKIEDDEELEESVWFEQFLFFIQNEAK